MTLDEKLEALEAAKARYLAAVSAMSKAVERKETSDSAWIEMAKELDDSDTALQSTLRRITIS